MLNPIDQGILLLCMHLDGDQDTGAQPLSASEWTILAKKLHKANLSPKDFLDFGDEDYYMLLNGETEQIYRYKKLLARGNRLSSELTRISEIGISVITRADERYPKSFKSQLGNLTPTILFVAGNIELISKPLIGVIGCKDIDDNDKTLINSLVKGIGHVGSVLVSGGHPGVDSYTEQSMLDEGGQVVSVINNSLVHRIRQKDTREELTKGTLLLVSPYGYNEEVSVKNLLVRNLMIIELSQKTFVVKIRNSDEIYYPMFRMKRIDVEKKIIAIKSLGKKSIMNDFIDEFGLTSVSRQDMFDKVDSFESILCTKKDLTNEADNKVIKNIKQKLNFETGELIDHDTRKGSKKKV